MVAGGIKESAGGYFFDAVRALPDNVVKNNY
jgi:hypothetical protein